MCAPTRHRNRLFICGYAAADKYSLRIAYKDRGILMFFKDYLIESDESDEWIQDYVYKESKSEPSKDILDELLHDHPYKGSESLYRGLNFTDEDHYRKFLRNTDNGSKLSTNTITSWTRDLSIAEQFSVTRPTYFLNKELMQAEDTKSRNKDYMIGHAGIIIKLSVKADTCIDLSGTGKGAEDEVILIAGQYNISIHKTNIPFISSITEDNYEDILHEINSLEEGFNKLKLEHILFRFADFTDSAKAKIWSLLKFKNNIRTFVTYDPSSGSDDRSRLRIHVGVDSAILYLYNWLLPEHQRIVRIAIKRALKKISEQVQDITNRDDIDYKRLKVDITHVTKLCQLMTGVDVYKHLDHHLADLYHNMNSRSHIDDINKMPRDEKIKSIKQFSDDIVQLIKNLQKS